MLVLLQVGVSFAQTTKIPLPDHIVILILENHGYSEIIGSTSAPHINTLAADAHSAVFTKSYAITHPSQPNYLDLFSGCDQGVVDDAVPTDIPYTTDNLGRQLLDAARSFVTYSEDLPSIGYNGASSSNYARKHNPAANWMGTGTNQIPTTTNQPFSAFPTDFTKLPDVCYVVPNQNNDMHNGSAPTNIKTGDMWMNTHLNSYVEWAKTHNSLFILTFDEDDNSAGNQVTTIFTGAMVKPGKYSETINHYSLLRTIEEMYGLPYACNAVTAKSIVSCWIAASVEATNPGGSDKVFWISTNPTTGVITVQIAKEMTNTVKWLRVSNIRGVTVFEKDIRGFSSIDIKLDMLGTGSYFVQVNDVSKSWTQKLVIP